MKKLATALLPLLLASSAPAEEPASAAAAPATATTATPAQPSGSVQIIANKGAVKRLPPPNTAPRSLGNAPLSDVVKAANETKKKKAQGKTKVITAKEVGKPKTGAEAPPRNEPDRPGGYGSVRDSKGRDENWWRQTMRGADSQITSLEQQIQSLDSEIAGLRSAFTSMDDPAYRDGVIKPKWDAAVADQARARQDLEQAKIRKEALLEDARRSGALSSWLY